MPYVPLKINPGVVRDRSRYAAEGTWYDCDKVRFREGMPESVKGWVFYGPGGPDDYLVGRPSKIHVWYANATNKVYIAYGTNEKLYIEGGSGPDNITPFVASGTTNFQYSSGNGRIFFSYAVVGDPPEINNGDYIVLVDEPPVGGIEINGEYRVARDYYYDGFGPYVFRGCLPIGEAPSSSGSTQVTAYRELHTGSSTQISGSAWGEGAWGEGAWGGAVPYLYDDQITMWSLDNYGDDLVANPRGGPICYWDETSGAGTRAVLLRDLARKTITLDTDPIATTSGSGVITVTDNDNLSSTPGHGVGVGDEVTISGAATTNGITADEINTTHTVVSVVSSTKFTVDTGGSASGTGTGGGSAVVVNYVAGEYYAPTVASQVVVTDERHIVAFGANPIGETNPDLLSVRWSDAEDPSVWKPTPQNLAEGRQLPLGSRFVGAVKSRQEILVWVDTGIISMRYGGDFIYTFDVIAEGVSMISPNAAISAFGSVYFMDHGGFYAYDGSVSMMPCPVKDYVFERLDESQHMKITASRNTSTNEIQWLYPSTDGSGENDSYVTYNTADNVWTFGTYDRTTWLHSSQIDYPLATEHLRYELGTNPFAYTTSQSTVVITVPSGHKLQVGDVVLVHKYGDYDTSPGTVDAVEVFNTELEITATTATTITCDITSTSTYTGSWGSTGAILERVSRVYKHENGYSANGSALYTYIESGDIDIENGDDVWFIRKIAPDIDFRGTYDTGDSVNMQILGHNYPHTEREVVADYDVFPDTELAGIRLRDRQIGVKISSNATGYGWRLGLSRLKGGKDGKR